MRSAVYLSSIPSTTLYWLDKCDSTSEKLLTLFAGDLFDDFWRRIDLALVKAEAAVSVAVCMAAAAAASVSAN